MSDVAELEKRIATLEKECRRLSDIEEIRQLRYRYWHAIRDGRVEDVLKLFSSNPTVDFGRGPSRGKEAVAELYRSSVGTWKPGGQYPRGYSPEIEITGENSARGHWMVEVKTLDKEKRLVYTIGLLYDEEYLREQGQWKISSLKLSYTFNEVTSMPALK